MLRMLTISHNRHNALQDLPPNSRNMNKDTPLVTTTIPDYHDGLHEKANNSKSDALPPELLSGSGFQASLLISYLKTLI